jgi:hypothetical protein
LDRSYLGKVVNDVRELFKWILMKLVMLKF